MTSTRRALVTGASSGIGLAFCRQLARRGSDLVVVARDVGRLEALAAQLSVDVEVLPADLTDGAALDTVAARLADGERPVDLLVNNAGVATSGSFADLPLLGERRMIALNIAALVELTHAALGVMVARGSGAVVNLASLGAFSPGPGYATYSATKAFVLSFSEALHEELRGTGVSVLALCPGFTHTELQARSGMSGAGIPERAWMSADAVVEAGLDALDRGRAVCVPGPQNRAMVALTKLLPRAATRRVAGIVASRT